MSKYKHANAAIEQAVAAATAEGIEKEDLLLALILGIAAVGLVNSMTIAALGRGREIGVLRALGMSGRDLRRTFALEGAMVAVLASLVSIAMAVPLGIALAAIATQKQAFYNPIESAEAGSTDAADSILVTTLGHYRAEGLGLVKPV